MLTDRLEVLYERTRVSWYHKYRIHDMPEQLISEKCRNVSSAQGMAEMLTLILSAEEPVIIPGEMFFYTRSVKGKTVLPMHGIPVENLTAEWEILLEQGLEKRIGVAEQKISQPGISSESLDFLQSAVRMMNAVLNFSERYAQAAEKSGDMEGAALLRKVPRYPAETLREAIQSVFFLFSMLHQTGVVLQGFGRMDQYFEPYYQHDIKNGILTREQAKELFSEFFLMLNRENDVYGCVQQGDDGESVMLGGCRRDGSDGYNDLTRLILESSYDVSMINPKINLRVCGSTPDDILLAGIRLTGRGLGFPQYCNDDVVIPALIHFGYPEADARDYTVAACWEFVLKNGRDIPNRSWVNLALSADRSIRKILQEHFDFEKVYDFMREDILSQLKSAGTLSWGDLIPNPLFSSIFGKCLERGKDIHAGGGDHYHYGILSVGGSTAADSLAAVKKFVFDIKSVSPEQLLEALENNFEGYADIRSVMQSGPKTGMNDSASNEQLKKVYDIFCDCMESVKDNGLGGRIRPGTGSAQGYAFLTQRKHEIFYLKAAANGRREGDFLESSLAPQPGTRSSGILSILKTYSKLNYTRLCNGGPITLEFSPAYFRNKDAISKTAEFIRAFVRSGCQQIQMNVLNKEKMLDAQIHPELHRDLIVRVWGWSGYFIELDRMFQNQIIGRQAYDG